MRIRFVLIVSLFVLIAASCSGGANEEPQAQSSVPPITAAPQAEPETTTAPIERDDNEAPSTTQSPPPPPTTELEPEPEAEPARAQLVDTRPGETRGINFPSLEWECVENGKAFDPNQLLTLETISGLSEVNVIRLPMNQSCWNNDTSVEVYQINNGVIQASRGTYRRGVEMLIDELASRGWQVILDLHWSAPNRQLATGQAALPDDGSVDFWQSIAATYAGDARVMAFELFNEPTLADESRGATFNWQCWQFGCETSEGWTAVGMQTLVDIIREQGAEQYLIVNGLEWANDLRGWLDHVPTDPLNKIVAGFHAYDINRCDDVDCWSTELEPITARYPLMITEFGDITLPGEPSGCDEQFNQALLDWAESVDAGFTGWGWFPGSCGFPSLISSWSGGYTQQGAVVCQRLGGSDCRVIEPGATSTGQTTASDDGQCQVNFQVASDSPPEIICTDGINLVADGSVLTGWKDKLSSYQIEGDWHVAADWERWQEVSEGVWQPVELGREIWSPDSSLSYGEQPANDRFQRLLITINGPGSLIIYQDNFGGNFVTFEVQ